MKKPKWEKHRERVKAACVQGFKLSITVERNIIIQFNLAPDGPPDFTEMFLVQPKDAREIARRLVEAADSIDSKN